MAIEFGVRRYGLGLVSPVKSSAIPAIQRWMRSFRFMTQHCSGVPWTIFYV